MARWGRNGIEVFEASGVTIQNLTVCNFLSGQDGSGNQIWWNGGEGTGQIHMGGCGCVPLCNNHVFQKSDPAQATYGIFAANADGPGLIDRTYASNMNDSSYYIGACPDCNAVLDHAHGENSVLGYSGTNSGGHLVIENSEFDRNSEGIDTNSASDGDLPAPQNGSCPAVPGHAGLSSTTSSTTTTTVTCLAMGSALSGRPRGSRWQERHDPAEPVRQQRRLGGRPGALHQRRGQRTQRLHLSRRGMG